MKRLSTVLLSSILAFGLVFAVGCDSTGGSADGESGTVELRMDGSSTTMNAVSSKTTAKTITEALVTIDEVSIVPSEDSTEGDSTEVGVQALTDENFEVDLKQLQAGLDTAMAEFEIPSGEYGQIRLITANEVSMTFDDGSQQDVMIASGQQTGLKVNNFDPFTIESPEDRVEVTLNWDVEESLKGNTTGRFVITPVIDATVDVTSGSDSTSSSGTNG